MYLARVYTGLGEFDAAVREFSTVVDQAPDTVPAHFALGQLYGQMGDLDRSRAAFETTIGLAPDWVEPYKTLGLLLLSQQLADTALVVYTKAKELSPEDASVHNNIGFVHTMLGNLKEAKSAYEKAVATSPDAATLKDAQANLEIVEAVMAGKLRVRHILVRSETEAQEILGKLEAGGDFGELARQHSTDPSAEDGGNLGFFSPGDMHPAFEKAVTQLEVGHRSGVVKTPLGYHIILRIN